MPCTLFFRLLHAGQYCLKQDKEGVQDVNLQKKLTITPG